jgi:hypothetical protein
MTGKADDQIQLIGKVGTAPSFQSLAGVGEIATLDVMTRVVRTSSKPEGSAKAECEAWHRVVAFLPAAIRQARDLSLNDNVVIHGLIERRQYDRDGEHIEIREIIAERILKLHDGPRGRLDRHREGRSTITY